MALDWILQMSLFDQRSERERLLEKDNWEVDVNNWRELGEVIAGYNHHIGIGEFVGTATMTLEDGIRKLEITLHHIHEEVPF